MTALQTDARMAHLDNIRRRIQEVAAAESESLDLDLDQVYALYRRDYPESIPLRRIVANPRTKDQIESYLAAGGDRDDYYNLSYIFTFEDTGEETDYESYQVAQAQRYDRFGPTRQEFHNLVATSDTGIERCPSCSGWQRPGNRVAYQSGDRYPWACQTCHDNYGGTCQDCGYECWEIGTDGVCDACHESHYRYCRRCDEWVDTDYWSDHVSVNHELADPKGKHLAFHFPNQLIGGKLAADAVQIVNIDTGGVITGAAVEQIKNIVCRTVGDDWYTSHFADENGTKHALQCCFRPGGCNGYTGGLDWVLKTETGSFAKRVSKFVYDRIGFRLPKDVVSRIGTIAGDSVGVDCDHIVTLSRNFGSNASDWVHSESCWFDGYSWSLRWFVEHGGIGLRTWDSATLDCPETRCWVLPLDDKLRPVNNANMANVAAYFVFNSYGTDRHIDHARIVAQLTGWDVAKVMLTDRANSYESVMYVNNETGFVVAPSKFIDQLPGSATLRHLSQSRWGSRTRSYDFGWNDDD